MNRTRWRNAFRKIYETTNEEQENESVSIYHSNDQECITSYADTEEEYYPEIGIPGGSIMFGSHSNFYRRIIWIGIFVIFLGLTVAQVHYCIDNYLEHPVSVDWRIVRNHTLNLPKLTICNRHPFNLTNMEKLRPLVAENLNVSLHEVRLPYDLLSLMDPSELWLTLSYDLDAVVLEDAIHRAMMLGNGIGFTPSWGRAIPTNQGATETGLFNGLYIKMRDDYDDEHILCPGKGFADDRSFGWIYAITTANVNPALAVYYGHDIYPNSSVGIELQLNKYENVNAWYRPCVSEERYDVGDCQVTCLSHEVIRRVGCRLPFMNQPHVMHMAPLCDTPQSYSKADNELREMLRSSLWKESSCNCLRACKTEEYVEHRETIYDLTDLKPNQLRLRMYFQDKTYSEFKERYSYGYISLFCDIGSSVTLLLGANLLTIMELLECILFIVQILWSRWRSDLNCCLMKTSHSIRPLETDIQL